VEHLRASSSLHFVCTKTKNNSKPACRQAGDCFFVCIIVILSLTGDPEQNLNLDSRLRGNDKMWMLVFLFALKKYAIICM
jgi:hypothetical protein